MTWVSESNLVSAISNAGGLGVLACGSMDTIKLESEILLTKKNSQTIWSKFILFILKLMN